MLSNLPIFRRSIERMPSIILLPLFILTKIITILFLDLKRKKKRKREREKIRIDFAAVDSSLTKLSRHFICKCASHLPEQLREIMNTFTAQYGRLDVFSTPPAAPTPVADVRHGAGRLLHFAFSKKFKFGDLSRDPVSSDLPIVTPVVTRIRWRSGRLK